MAKDKHVKIKKKKNTVISTNLKNQKFIRENMIATGDVFLERQVKAVKKGK